MPQETSPPANDMRSPTTEERLAITSILDPTYYLDQNPDVKAANADPIDHFYYCGWREGRNPSPFFDVSFYLEVNPDVAAAGINPVIHYVRSGAKEGRLPLCPVNSWRKILEAADSPRKHVASWAGAASKLPLLPAGELGRAVLAASSGAGLVVSFSHDDYLSCYGGVQNVIGDEQRAFGKEGWGYLHVAPAAPLPILSDETSGTIFRVSVRINGEQRGVVTFDELTAAVSALRKSNVPIECIVHHCLGFSPELIGDFIKKTGLENPIFWIHDFFWICPSYSLMRNDVIFCGGPPPDSGACKICCYGTERRQHLRRVRALFENARPRVLAPSQGALDLWKHAGGLPYLIADVVPLARLVRAPLGKIRAIDDFKKPLRVGFTGGQVFRKGWTLFTELAYRHAKDARYAFFHLGQSATLQGGIRHHSVTVNRENRNAMMEAVAKARIDLVINWALWPETFCFTALEALAGGAFVVARTAAGNVWPAIQANAPNQGCAVSDEAQLFTLFQRGEMIERVRNADCRYGILIFGRGAADWRLRHRQGEPVMQSS
jgi:hypothetical protein